MTHRNTPEAIPVSQRERGRYRLLATLGRGGMADVYLGAASGPAGFNKLVVVKKLRADSDDPMLTEMFLDEARVSARLNHPNVVQTYEVDKSQDGYSLVMEYLEGQPLRRYAYALRERDGRLGAALAAHLVSLALDGLHYVHEMRDYDGSPLGIVHRDVSPHNLFITYDGQVKVLDFGIAKGKLNSNETSSGVIKGKVSYMAPEQVRSCTGVPGEADVDRRADIFSAGIVLWELITGAKLFKGDQGKAMQAVLFAPIPAPSALTDDVHPELDAIVLKALERSPAHRYPTAAAMSKALADFVRRIGPVRREDIAEQMTTLFQEQRERVAKTVQSCMATLSADPDTPIDQTQLPSVPRSTPSESMPTSTIGTLIAASIRRPSARPRRRAAPLGTVILGLLATLVLGGVGTMVVRPDWKQALRKGHADPPVSIPTFARTTPANLPTEPPTDTACHLTLSSDPPEAEVEWGGTVIGQTPLLIDLPAGPQTFILSHEGHFKGTIVLNITETMVGRSETRTVVLTPRPRPRITPAPVASKPRAELPASALLIDPFADLPSSPNLNPTPSAPAPERTYVEITSSHPVEITSQRPSPPPPPAPVAGPAAPSILPFGPEMSRPTLLAGGDIVYPREAIAATIAGTIISKCTITTDGTLRNCRIIKGLPFLDKAALDALGTRRYTPVSYQGKPVAVEYVVSLKVAPPQILH